MSEPTGTRQPDVWDVFGSAAGLLLKWSSLFVDMDTDSSHVKSTRQVHTLCPRAELKTTYCTREERRNSGQLENRKFEESTDTCRSTLEQHTTAVVHASFYLASFSEL